MTPKNTLKGKIVAGPFIRKDEVAERLTDMGKEQLYAKDNNTS